MMRDLLAAHCRAAAVEVWAWWLMPNHVHLILVPSDPDGLRRALAHVHRRYAGVIQARRKRTGHFWQGRFGAVAMDESHLAAALPSTHQGSLPELRRSARQRTGGRSVRRVARRREHWPATRT